MDIFSVYDSKADTYGRPFFSQNSATAEREFQQAVNVPSSPDRPNALYDYSEDYTLFLIGSYDENTGMISAYSPRSVINALKLRKVVE